MVALSVSISAMTSPDLTGSPSFLCHFARFPFSIVGESAGINTWIGMGAYELGSLFIDVVVELGRIWLGIIGGEFGRFIDDRAHFAVDLLQRVLVREPALQQAAGGTWGGCVYDVESIVTELHAGRKALGKM